MKKQDKLIFLINNYPDLYTETFNKCKQELSDNQTIFCCCGRLATGLHERNCSKFKDKVDSAVIKELKYLFK